MEKQLLALLMLFTLSACAPSLKALKLPPAPSDLMVIEPLPESTGDKGMDAIQYAAAAKAKDAKILGWQKHYQAVRDEYNSLSK